MFLSALSARRKSKDSANAGMTVFAETNFKGELRGEVDLRVVRGSRGTIRLSMTSSNQASDRVIH